jgi:hypothetical protein
VLYVVLGIKLPWQYLFPGIKLPVNNIPNTSVFPFIFEDWKKKIAKVSEIYLREKSKQIPVGKHSTYCRFEENS